MSGICGWNNNNLALNTGADILQRMSLDLHINPHHSVSQEYLKNCALATVGPPSKCGIHHHDGLFAAIQGSCRWLDAGLAQKARDINPAHALLEAYSEEGVNLFRRLEGSFSLCIMDRRHGKTILAIDRLGINSLFFTHRNGQVIFSSNARAIQRHPDFQGGVDPQALFDYLYFHMIPSPRSIFEGVEKLLPGQYLLAEQGKVTKVFYWQPDYREPAEFRFDPMKSEFLRILRDSVSRTEPDSATGTFLSGGTDSSTVAGMLKDITGKPVSTYSIGFDAAGYDEMEYARVASRHFATKGHEYYLEPEDVVRAIPQVARVYDEPFGNASAIAAYYCARLAKSDGMDTLLAGDGGDELFGGNERYAKQKVFELYLNIPKSVREHLIEPVILGFPGRSHIRPIAKAESYIRQANVPLPDRLESYNFLNRIPLEQIFDKGFLDNVDVNEPISYLRETYQRTSARSSLNKMLYLDLKFTLADNDLRKVNRMCELAQMEVCYPLLDEKLLEFSTRIPSSMKVRGFKLRYFFKQALKDFLPVETINKTKHGFGLPFGLWMNTHQGLRELALDSLAGLSGRGIIKPEFIATLQSRHQEHPNYYGVMIWVLMMLEQWLQTNETSTGR